MSRQKILTVLGARPNFVKASALSRYFSNSSIEEITIHTGQHFDYEMSQGFFDALNIEQPKYNLGIAGVSHGKMVGRIIEKVEEIILHEKPSSVLVYGDTDSTLGGAISAAKQNVPVIHVEAGLRSFNNLMPEEKNRRLTDHVSNLLFCPTSTAVQNLDHEGITKGVYQVGDIMYDTSLYAMKKMDIKQKCLDSFGLSDKKFIFLTLHRAENTNDKQHFLKLIQYVENHAKDQNIPVFFPIHPRTNKLINDLGITLPESFIQSGPQGYFETQALLSASHQVFTDSGGLQKEAYFHKVPCVTLRKETEWVETIEAGWNRLWDQESYLPRKAISDYGTGHSAEEIGKIIEKQKFF